MANDELSDLLGGVLCGPRSEEKIVTMIADGTAKAGDVVADQGAEDDDPTHLGIAVGVDVDGNVDNFVGIQLQRYDTDMDDAPTAGDIIEVVIPKSGHNYRVKVTDLNLDGPGNPLNFGNTTGALSIAAAVEGAIKAWTYEYNDGDTYAVVTWA